MSWRVVIVRNRAKIDYRMGYMVVRGREEKRVFMDEIHTVIVETTAVSLTAAWINECMRRKIKLLFCDERHNPSSEVFPLHGSHDSSRRIRSQAGWTEEAKGLVWQAVVREKLRHQARLLRDYDHPLEADILEEYREEVEPRDKTNREGHGAKVYFQALFGPGFTRDDPGVINGALNYGYAILLSACSREISSAGYVTELGIFHKNVFNPYNLGSDLMEPFRPLVDRMVLAMEPSGLMLRSEEKHRLAGILNEPVLCGGKKTYAALAVGAWCRSCLEAVEKGDILGLKTYDYQEEIHAGDGTL